jgi:hypothetical protein
VQLAQLITMQTNIAEGTENYRFIDMAFGLPSDSASLPESGSASFKLALRGSRSSDLEAVPLPLSGDGMARVDFASGRLDFRGTSIDMPLPYGVGVSSEKTEVTGTATLAAEENGFAGTFEALTPGTPAYAGNLTGSFYGPRAEEIGGTLFGTSGSLYYSLAFTGFELPVVAHGDTLDALTGQNRLDTVERIVNLPESDPFFVQNPFGEHIIYNGDTQTYSVFGMLDDFGPINRTPANDQGDVISYGAAVAIPAGKAKYEIALFDGETDGIELTYTSFLRVLETDTDLDGGLLGKEVSYFGFGNATPPDQLPRSGVASYTGRLFGDVNDGTDLLSPLTGTSSLEVDFGAQALVASLSPVATSLEGSAVDFGTFDFAGKIDGVKANFEGSRMDGEGTLSGQFFGDKAQEFAATFGLYLEDRGLMLEGVTLGRQDDPGAP